MTKIKEILEDNGGKSPDNFLFYNKEQLNTAASAIEKVHDEEMVGFLKWFCLSYEIRSDYSEHTLIDSINKDYHAYKNRNPSPPPETKAI